MKIKKYGAIILVAGTAMKVFIKPTLNAVGPLPVRTCGIAHRDAIATIIFGAIVGQLVEKKPHHGIAAMFLLAPFVHVLFGVKTGLNHQLGLSAKPDGTGPLALPVDQN